MVLPKEPLLEERFAAAFAERLVEVFDMEHLTEKETAVGEGDGAAVGGVGEGASVSVPGVLVSVVLRSG